MIHFPVTLLPCIIHSIVMIYSGSSEMKLSSWKEKQVEKYISGKVCRLSKQVLIISKLNFNSIQTSKLLTISLSLKKDLKC